MNIGLNATCAQTVQLVHTTNTLGTSMKRGTIDFFANNVSIAQPNCMSLAGMVPTCSHYTAVYLFYSSIDPNNKFIGADCSSMMANPTNTAQFGEFFDNLKKGVFCFTSGACYPYTAPAKLF